jgi:hypothetical protein
MCRALDGDIAAGSLERNLMIQNLLFRAALPVCALFAAVGPPVFAEAPSVNLIGVIRDSGDGKAIPQAQIVAHEINSGANFSGVSGGNGLFSITLEPGNYEVTVSKTGFGKYASTVKVSPKKTPQFDVMLTANPVSSAQLANELAAMKQRIDQLEAELKAKNSQQTAANESIAKEPAKETLLATTATDSGLLLRLPAPAAKPDDLQLLAANTPTPQAAAAAASAAPPAPAPAPGQSAPPAVPDALTPPEPGPAVDNFTFGAYGDFTWLNGTPRNKDTVLDTKFFTPEIRFDTHYMQDFNQPKDHTIGGATESFRAGEVQLEQASVGGDFHWQNVRGRVLFMTGLFATTTPRNDASYGVGQWDLRGAYKYTSEAWGGYHFNVQHGINVDAGIFVSYIGLFSYYNFDNWTYQPSYVSSNTPWFFNGVRVQWYPTNKLKIEPWFINGWQSYGKFNGHPGLGGQILWLPKEWFKLVLNNYGHGQDNLGLPYTERLHTDDSIEIRFYNNPSSTGLSKIAMSLTADAGIQTGGGICGTCGSSNQKNSFLGWMAYNRYWFHKDLWALTFGGGMMSNPGRYLTLLPPINGADAVTGSPYFPQTPGLKSHMYDATVTLQYMPRQYLTWWAEMGYRHADIPYFTGRGGITPPGTFGGTNGAPGQVVCGNGSPSGTSDFGQAATSCGSSGIWYPDLRRSEAKLSFGVMVKF